MTLTDLRGKWGELIITAGFSLVLYHLNVLFFLFLLPLQLVFLKRGFRDFFRTSGLVILVIGLIKIFQMRGIEDTEVRNGLLLLDMAMPTLLWLGMLCLNLEWEGISRKLHRLVLAVAVMGLGSLPVLWAIARNQPLQDVFTSQLEALIDAFASASAEETSMTVLLQGFYDGDVMRLIVEVMLRNYLFSFAFLLTAVWRFSAIVYGRMTGMRREIISGFKVDDVMIWPLLAGLAGILLDLVMDTGVFAYLAWNVGLFFLFLFILQGWGILMTILGRSEIGRRWKRSAGFLLVMGLLWPGLNLVIVIGVAGLGISELWVDLRKRDNKE